MSKGLKALGQAPQLEELKVTPELRAKLRVRLAAAEQEPAPVGRPGRPWLMPAVSVAAVAGVLVLAVSLSPVDRGAAPVRDGAVADLPKPYKQSSSSPGTSAASTSGQLNTVIVKAEALDRYDLSGGKFTVKLTDANGSTVAAAGVGTAEAQPGRKIITNAEYALRVADARAASERLQGEALAAGGYVAEAAVNKEGDGSWVGRVVLRIPAGRLGPVTQLLGQVGSIERERQWTQDVTDQYMDLEHRMAVLKEHEERLRELAAKATTFDDWNKLAGQINSTRVEIENLAGRHKLLGNQVEYAVLNVALYQPAPGAPPVAKGATTLGGQAGEAFSNSVGSLVSLGRRLVIGLAALAPAGVVGLVVLAVGLVFLRRRRRREAAEE